MEYNLIKKAIKTKLIKKAFGDPLTLAILASSIPLAYGGRKAIMGMQSKAAPWVERVAPDAHEYIEQVLSPDPEYPKDRIGRYFSE